MNLDFTGKDNNPFDIDPDDLIKQDDTSENFWTNDIFKNELNMLLNKKRLFKVIYPEKDNSISESCSDESLLENENYDFAKKERWGKRKRRYFYRDNILQKVKRNFHNIYLIKYLNNILKKENSIIFFDLFPQAFVNDVSIKDNKNILNMTLKEIFEKRIYIKVRR